MQGVLRLDRPSSNCDLAADAACERLLRMNWLRSTVRAPILGGPLRGMWWAVGAGGKVVRLACGSYERRQVEIFATRLHPGAVFFDVGAHAGYYAMLGARIAGPQGCVVAFEPHPRNAYFLHRHIAWNRLWNVKAYQAAAGSENGAARFQLGHGTATGRLSQHGQINTVVCRLDDVARAEGVRPTHIKLDVEGAELSVLQGAVEILERDRPMVFLSTHGAELQQQCRRFLEEYGYSFEPLLGDDIATCSELLCIA